jgi:LCP family protein required for cell wall assembly
VLLGIFAVIVLALCGLIVPRLFTVQDVASSIFVTPPPRPPGAAAFPDWGKQERVNILLLGLDTRVPGDSRSDTMILVSVDPAAKTATLISIPRDLWITIPGFGENRINAAYQFGETNKVAGGGPGLAMQTVEQNFGVPVHYFAQVDFEGFRGIVDALGGVTVDVQRPLIDNEYPSETGSAYQRIYIPMGLQHMDGRTALQYVRSRHADSDLGRNERQQGMLLALREQGTQISVLGKIDAVLGQLKGAVRTDLSFTQVGSLAKLAQGIPRDKVQQLSIGDEMVSDQNMNGADVLVPRWEVIRPAIQAITGGAAQQAETATVAVMNGTDTAGLARNTAEKLRNAGFTVPDSAVGNPADGGGGRYPQTRILDYSGGQKPATLRRLLDVLKLTADRVQRAANGPPGVDLEVLIGDDFTP